MALLKAFIRVLALVAVLVCVARAGPKRVTVSNCGDYEVRPDFIMIACADGGDFVESLKWSQWSAVSALGTGIEKLNDCEPSCAAGKFHSYSVKVKLYRVISGQFARLRLTYAESRPASRPKTVTFQFYKRE